MIQIFNDIEKLKVILDELESQKVIQDYRIYLKSNNCITIYCLEVKNQDIANHVILENYNVEIEFISQEDQLLKELYFEKKTKINIFDSHKRLANLLPNNEKVNGACHNKFCNTPIVTFYSYKGGVGRSTTLAACASYLSLHHSKKIVIIDCDFEAPGFTNFFLEEPGIPLYSNGVIEYLLDKEYKDDDINVRNYLWETSKIFSGEGEIYVMPSGNLNDGETISNNSSDLVHYLQGLARIDFSENPFIIERFKELIKNIEKEINPDAIFLDSRTGFNDIFGVTAFQLSNLVIGFFGNNVQSVPGIHFFLNSILNRMDITGILVNSILPVTHKRSWFQDFKDQVEQYINSLYDNGLYSEHESGVSDDPITIDMFPVSRHEVLEMLGIKREDKLNFIDFIESRSFGDYGNLFQKINSILDDYQSPGMLDSLQQYPPLIEESDESEEETEIYEEIIEEENSISEGNNNSPIYQKKMTILGNLQTNMSKLYAEEIQDFEQEFRSGKYFYRKCMLDIFNLDKFLILGNKGTGKTYIYQSLKNKTIVNELRSQANKHEIEYKFLHVIDKTKYFIDTTKFDGLDSEFSTEKFYERFWQIYIWNVISTEMMDKEYVPSISLFPISDKTETALKFKDIIYNDQEIIKIENDLEKIDSLLKNSKDLNIIIVFDELDHVVKPYKWSERIAPLINLCKKFTFNRIYPKLFLRSDLYEKISNVNNIQALKNRSINIEWDREELFSYFFKMIIAHSKEIFFDLMKEYRYYPNKYINKTKKLIDDNQSQPPLDDYVLRHLCATFFGKYADVNNTPRFGESYDWFFRNLKNANDTISLRPFIDLLSEAVKWALQDDKKDRPILPQHYYTHGIIREKAVERHFKDLAKEEGNGDLIHIFNYIRNNASPDYKRLELNQKDFYELINQIIQNSNLDNNNIEDVIDLLKINGIIKDRFVRTGSHVNKKYQFALLYKYYLGLRNKK